MPYLGLPLNRGRAELAATPRALYAQPATTFAASFIGTPAMNLLRLQDGRIAGSAIEAGAGEWLGIRPEAIALGSRVPATVRSSEYLGADLILRCAIGSETVTVRTEGATQIAPGSEVRLDWPQGAAHHFDSQGNRIQF